MTLKDFERLLETRGADLRRWPDPVRREAEALLARSGTARRARDEAARLDRLLRPTPVVIDRTRLDRVSGAVMAAIRTLPPRPAGLFDWLPWRPAAAALAMLGAAGWMLGAAMTETAGVPMTAARTDISAVFTLDTPSLGGMEP